MSYMTICAETEDGAVEDVIVDSANPPRIGDTFDDDGRTLTRVVTSFGVRVTKYGCKAVQLPRKHVMEAKGLTPAPHYDSKGWAHMPNSKRATDEYMAAHNDNEKNGTTITWDRDQGE